MLTQGSYAEHISLMQSMIDRIRNTIVDYNGQQLSVTMTFGLIDASGYASSDEMVKVVDTLLYYGKENGRNRLVTS